MVPAFNSMSLESGVRGEHSFKSNAVHGFRGCSIHGYVPKKFAEEVYYFNAFSASVKELRKQSESLQAAWLDRSPPNSCALH